MDNHLPLDCSLDKLLNGGLEIGVITEIYGEGGTGKTNICIQAAKSCARHGKRTIYIDAEGVSKDRLLQVFKEKKALEKVLFFSPFSLKEQEEMIKKAVKIDSGLIIVDSTNLFYRLEMDANKAAATRSLTKQLVQLQIEARRKNIPVIVTGQVYLAGEEVKPFAGRSIDHIAKTIIRIEKTGSISTEGKEERQAVIIKHRSISEGKQIRFFITGDGIE